jgi:hypothetical protein
LGSDPKLTTLKDLIKVEKPIIYLLHETKMAATKVLKIRKKIWKNNRGIEEDSKGTSEGIGTLWNEQEVSMIFYFQTPKWIISMFKIIKGGFILFMLNLYMSVPYMYKEACWKSILNLKETEVM